MAADLTIIDAEPGHIAAVAENMRQADRDEVMAASGNTPQAALEFSLARSTIARSVVIGGEVAGMFGVGDLNILGRTGAPWLLGTERLSENPAGFLRASIHWREQLLDRYAVLRNLVDERNHASQRWLRWLGFSLSEPFIIGHEGRPFRLFELRRNHV